MALQVDAATARRFLAIRHILTPPRSLPASSDGVLAAVDRLGSLQFDPLEVAGRNHDLVLHARVEGYSRALTDELLYGRRLLFEAQNKALCLVPTKELPYYRVGWERAAAGRSGQMLAEQAALATRILATIEADGPQASTDFERGAPIDWYWGPTTAARAVLEALNATGRLNLARREGNRRYFELTERLFPADLLAVKIPEREQLRHKLLSRYRGHGLLGAGGTGELWPGTGTSATRAQLRQELRDRGELVAVAVEGMRSERYIIADELPLLTEAEREIPAAAVGCAFLAPLDPLLWDRSLLEPLYGFDYRWEVYVPAHKRRWGYYVLPILFGDKLVGRIEPRIDRRTAEVRILSLGWEDGFLPLETPGFLDAFTDALRAYLGFGGARVLVPAPEVGRVPLFEAIAGRLPVRREAAI